MTGPKTQPPLIFQTRRWPHAAEQALDRLGTVIREENDTPLDQGRLRAGLAECDIFCPTVSDTIDATVISGLDLSGKLVANYGAGVSHIDREALRAAGAVLANTPDILTDATAEVAIMLMLATARRAGEGERELRSGEWQGWRPMHMLGRGVSGKTLGLVGFGRIAQAVARMAHHGFGMEVLVGNRSPVDDAKLESVAARQLPLEAVLARSDFVSLHIPGGETTRHFLNADRLADMKAGAILINTARGEVVDTAALVAALDGGRLAGAGLDVFENEPDIPPALSQREDVVLLPHLGSATLETRTAMGLRVVENVSAWLHGETPRDVVL